MKNTEHSTNNGELLICGIGLMFFMPVLGVILIALAFPSVRPSKPIADGDVDAFLHNLHNPPPTPPVTVGQSIWILLCVSIPLIGALVILSNN